jgi:hypothetical protein
MTAATSGEATAESATATVAALEEYIESEQQFAAELMGARRAAEAAGETLFLQQGDAAWRQELNEIQHKLNELEAADWSAGAVADPTIEDIHAAWRAREAKLRSLRVAWKGKVLTPRGTRVGPFGGAGQVAPPEDTTHDRSGEVMLDGGKLRYWWSGWQWLEQRVPQGFYPQTYVSASDGKTSLSIYFRSVDSRSQLIRPVGFIHEGPENADASNYHIGPILFFARPLDPEFGLLGRAPDDKNGPPLLSFKDLDGVRCAVITQPAGRRVKEIWVDPASSYVIRRYVVYYLGKLSYQIDLKYAAHSQLGWTPQSWQIHHWLPAQERLDLFESAAVASVEINPQIDLAEFRPAFPAGAVVRDARNDIEFLVRDDGTKREITDEERRRNATYQEILQTESGEAGLTRIEEPQER